MNFLEEDDYLHLKKDEKEYEDNFENSCSITARLLFHFHAVLYFLKIKQKMINLEPN